MRKRLLIGVLTALPFMILLSGCGGGVNGEGTNLYPQTGGVPIVRADSFNDKGWDMMAKNQWSSAVAAFQQVLSDNPTPDEEAEANNGMGWAYSHIGALVDGMPWFEKALSLSDDAKVGFGAAFIQKGSKTDLEMAAEILYKKLGRENAHFHYVPRRNTGVSDAEVHAMLAYAYAGIGQDQDAMDQMAYAKELNPNWAGTTIDQLDKMVTFLLR